jgi:hypothetical protein
MLVGLLAFAAMCVAGSAPAAWTGKDLYLGGVLPGGQSLHGTREANAVVEGATGACVNCHKRSGLGSAEGRVIIPPIAGPYLFRPPGQRIDDTAVPFVGESGARQQAYSELTLARAIRDGIGADGRTLSYLMPRYRIGDTAMKALIGYLKDMMPRHVPGVSDTVLHFATIVTPDADPTARQGMLDVLENYFQEKNAAARAIAPRVYATRPTRFRVNRKWQLHVWSLTGAPQTWETQLRAHLAAEPVFAAISGIAGRSWGPVHDFCESVGLPCLFANVEVPVTADRDTYTVYFSRGVLVEAQLIARRVRERESEASPRRVVQVYRSGDVGEAAAGALREAARHSGVKVLDRVLPRNARAAQLGAAVGDLMRGDSLVLWLRANDLRQLPQQVPGTQTVWVSGLMGGLESAPLPQAWRALTRMTYPFDLPARRVARVDYGLGWFRIRRIPIVAEQVQSDTYLACGLLSEVLNNMVDTFQRDYLIERLDELVEHRVLTGYYPHLTLGAGQSFASKGAYLVRLGDSPGLPVVPEGEWTVP